MFSVENRWPHYRDSVKVEWNLGKRCNYDCSYCPAEIHDNFSKHTDIKILKNAENAQNFSQCDSILIGDKCGAHTFPYIDVKNPSAKMEHEATTSSIGEDQLFYCNQRGIKLDDAVSMIVNGFCKEVFEELPMEFAVEAKQLIEVTLENSVG